MKKIGIAILVLVLSGCGASTKVLKPNNLSKVVEVENHTKDELYIKANNWMVETFNNAKSVIQFTDKESGTITGKYLMKQIIVSTTISDEVYAIIKIQVKDNAAKIEIKPNEYVNRYNTFAGGVSYTLEQANADMERLINSFEAGMNEAKDSF